MILSGCIQNMRRENVEKFQCQEQRAHSELSERTKYDSNLAKVIHEVRVRAETYKTQAGVHAEFLPTPTCSCLKKHGSMGHRALSSYKPPTSLYKPPSLLTPDEGPSLERSIFPLSFQVVTELLPFAYH